jgi:hypothetical protein
MSLHRRQGKLGGVLALLVLALLVAGCGESDDAGFGGAESTTPRGAGEPGGAAGAAKAEEFGSEASGAEAEGPEAALRGYLDARANGDWSKACAYVSKELSKFYGRLDKDGGCAGFVEKTTEGLSADERAALADVEIESVRLEGDSGYVIYADAEGSQQARPVEREGATWKVRSQIVQLLERAQEKSGES